MVNSYSFFDPGRLTRRQFLNRSVSLGVGAAAAAMTWEALAARRVSAQAVAPLPELSSFLGQDQVAELLKLGLAQGASFAEVYGEYTVNTGIRFDEQKVKSMEYGILSGVGIRVIDGEQVGYAYADSFDMDELREAARVASAIAHAGSAGTPKPFQVSSAKPPFVLKSPLPTSLADDTKLSYCRRIDAAARAVDPRIKQVTAVWGDIAHRFIVANSNGLWADDAQYITRLNAQVMALDGTNRQMAIARSGGQVESNFYDENPPDDLGKQAATKAIAKLASRDVKAGNYEVVVGPGWGGVLVHECFGHSLEGDGIRKKTSVRATQMGQKVAADIVNIYDDGTVPNSRGSFRVDDEGTPAQKNHVVENGVLRGYLWDYLNGSLSKAKSTGNGRRNSYRDYPIPRMTNTYIGAGTAKHEDIIASVKSGVYCADMGGGSVNPADGNFSFAVTEAYQIEDGKIAYPLKNATITGNANDAMLKIVMLGDNLEIDKSTGNCGKEGQWKPVGVGQPTVKFSAITVGGTA